MGKDKLGVCVVGLGIGYAHARSYSKMEDVDLYVSQVWTFSNFVGVCAKKYLTLHK